MLIHQCEEMKRYKKVLVSGYYRVAEHKNYLLIYIE
jgi:hypothetical protein